MTGIRETVVCVCVWMVSLGSPLCKDMSVPKGPETQGSSGETQCHVPPSAAVVTPLCHVPRERGLRGPEGLKRDSPVHVDWEPVSGWFPGLELGVLSLDVTQGEGPVVMTVVAGHSDHPCCHWSCVRPLTPFFADTSVVAQMRLLRETMTFRLCTASTPRAACIPS